MAQEFKNGHFAVYKSEKRFSTIAIGQSCVGSVPYSGQALPSRNNGAGKKMTTTGNHIENIYLQLLLVAKNLQKCGYKKRSCSGNCKCFKSGLACTALCSCTCQIE